MRSFVLFAAALVAAVPITACSLAVSTTGLIGGDDGDPDDGASDVSRDVRAADEAATPGAPDSGDAGEIGVDSSTSDATNAGDATDASITACVEGAGRFCAHFDEQNPMARWTRTYLDRGQVTFDGVGLSAPNALKAKVTAGSGSAAAALIKDLPSAATFRCELDMKLESFPTGAGAEFDVVNLLTDDNGPNATSTHQIYMAAFSGQWGVGEFQGRTPTSIDRKQLLGAALPTGSWFHVVLAASATSVTLTANGQSATLGGLAVPSGTGRSIQFGIPFASDDTSTASVLIDNVDCTTSTN